MSLKIHSSPVVGPCIHGNGTSAERLRDALESAYTALDAAYNAIRETAPNGRDYYIGPVSLSQADRQFMERLDAVCAVKDSIEAEIGLIDQQGA